MGYFISVNLLHSHEHVECEPTCTCHALLTCTENAIVRVELEEVCSSQVSALINPILPPTAGLLLSPPTEGPYHTPLHL